ncbi:MAG: hypothetical protein M1587_00465, partial [Thaumarchaeota archaeon]|nr:hypothetical protein [Nitrososphaerota archaeon]
MGEIESTSVKTIRLPKALEKSLEKEARARKTSLNSFIVSLLEKFNEWDRLADKFGVINITEDALMSILEKLNEDQIVKIAKDCGASIPKAMMEFWFSRVSYETFLKYLSLRSAYQNFVKH